MTKHIPAAAPATRPEGVRFRPDRFDRIALGIITETVRDANGSPFLTPETAMRFALGLAVRVIGAGRQAEFMGLPASALLNELPGTVLA